MSYLGRMQDGGICIRIKGSRRKKQGSRIQGVEGPRVKELIGFIGLLGLRKKGSPAQTFGVYDKGARFQGFLIRCSMLDVRCWTFII
jgi:hypothetical protein